MTVRRQVCVALMLLLLAVRRNAAVCPTGCTCDSTSVRCRNIENKFPSLERISPEVHTIAFSDCLFPDIPTEAIVGRRLPRLKRLTFTSCKLGVVRTGAIHDLHNVTEIAFHGHSSDRRDLAVNVFERGAISSVSNVHSFSFSHSKIGTVRKSAVSGVSRLRFITFDDVLFATVDSGAFGFSEAIELNVTNVDVSDPLSVPFDGMVDIQKVNMINVSWTLLAPNTVPQSVIHMKAHNTSFETVSCNAITSHGPASLTWTNGRVHCDCRIAWMWRREYFPSALLRVFTCSQTGFPLFDLSPDDLPCRSGLQAVRSCAGSNVGAAGSLSGGAIAGIVIVVLLVLAAIAAGSYFWFRHYKNAPPVRLRSGVKMAPRPSSLIGNEIFIDENTMQNPPYLIQPRRPFSDRSTIMSTETYVTPSSVGYGRPQSAKDMPLPNPHRTSDYYSGGESRNSTRNRNGSRPPLSNNVYDELPPSRPISGVDQQPQSAMTMPEQWQSPQKKVAPRASMTAEFRLPGDTMTPLLTKQTERMRDFGNSLEYIDMSAGNVSPLVLQEPDAAENDECPDLTEHNKMTE